jgi:hypothetical protein
MRPLWHGARLATFIREDLCVVGERARTMYRCEQEASAEELRRATALQQARETLKERLQSFLEVADSEPQRLRIRDCLERTDVEDMRNVLRDVESYFRHAGPEQWILMLLESLKEFCGDMAIELKLLISCGLWASRKRGHSSCGCITNSVAVRSGWSTSRSKQIFDEPARKGVTGTRWYEALHRDAARAIVRLVVLGTLPFRES